MKDKTNKICSVCGSANRVHSIDGIPYCNRHYTQIKIYGKILERTKFDKNEIVFLEDHAEIVLYDEKCKEVARALIDLEDVEKVKDLKWFYTQGYVRNAYKNISLHDFVMDFKTNKETVIDHDNRNRLDCRKSNLKVATQQENAINKGRQSNNTSGFPGVSWDRFRNKFAAYIKINKKKIFLGRFDTLEEAIQERIKGELEYFGKVIDRENDKYTVFKNKELNYAN